MPIENRPRERVLSVGIESLSDNEVLSLILQKGYGTKSVIDVSNELIKKYGLNTLSELSIEELKRDLSARVEIQPISSRSGKCGLDGDYGSQSYTDYFDEDGNLMYTEYEHGVPRGVSDVDRRGETKPDISTRLKAVNQAGQQYRKNISEFKDLLLETYQNSDNKSVRIHAGKELGYSSLKIWAHENPVVATIAGIGASSGLVYALIEYLSK
ncbi:MAG: hypothetical protein KJ583_00790 [Nanoarchaeota archaeon]|nr:hypothetical protein [Nanoarchaeota archaeon]MBU1269354.1 hypothetical protein [Nanoarchaeota archaeon]MBU1603826.1 hypothetical protein [Nanoarchaeota archaeon]MBU2443018.1 hypothetical protein [Nanoarchaeota archaeon]